MARKEDVTLIPLWDRTVMIVQHTEAVHWFTPHIDAPCDLGCNFAVAPRSVEDIVTALRAEGFTVIQGSRKRKAPWGIVKLLGMIVSPGNSRRLPDAIFTDSTLRPPVCYP